MKEGFLPFLTDKMEIEKLDWEDFKASCPCNRQFAKKVLHQTIPGIKCEATSFKCEPVGCPFLHWISMLYKYGEDLFQFLEKSEQ